jgi:hypothetical protein
MMLGEECEITHPPFVTTRLLWEWPDSGSQLCRARAGMVATYFLEISVSKRVTRAAFLHADGRLSVAIVAGYRDSFAIIQPSRDAKDHRKSVIIAAACTGSVTLLRASLAKRKET